MWKSWNGEIQAAPGGQKEGNRYQSQKLGSVWNM